MIDFHSKNNKPNISIELDESKFESSRSNGRLLQHGDNNDEAILENERLQDPLGDR